MPISLNTYHSLLARQADLSEKLEDEKSRREAWTRRYYHLLFAVEEAFIHCGVKLEEWTPAEICEAIKNLKPDHKDVDASTDARPAFSHTPSGYDPDGYYVAAHTAGDFGDFPRWTVAHAACDAPLRTVDLVSADRTPRSEPRAGAEDGPSAPHAIPAATLSRNSPRPLSFEDYPYTHITPAV